MIRPSRRAVIGAAILLVIGVALVESAAARGGARGGGGGRGGGAAARGSLGQNRGAYRNDFDRRGPAAYGNFGQYPPSREDWERRHERREERRDRRDGVVDVWEDYGDYYEYGDDSYADDAGYDDGYDQGYEDEGYDDAGYDEGDEGYEEGEVYDELPCQPAIVSSGGTAYYVCDSVWYIRVYSGGELVYVEVPPPTEE